MNKTTSAIKSKTVKTNLDKNSVNMKLTNTNLETKGDKKMKKVTTTIKDYKTEKGAMNFIANNKDKNYYITKNKDGLYLIKEDTYSQILSKKEIKAKEIKAINEEIQTNELEIIKSNYNKKALDKNAINELKSEIVKINKENFILVNKDYAELSKNKLYANYTKKQKLSLLKDRYNTKDSQLNIIVDIKMLNLSLDNELTVGNMRDIIKLINNNDISKGSVNGKNVEQVTTLLKDTKKAIKARLEKQKRDTLKAEIKKELLTINTDKKVKKDNKVVAIA